MARHEPSPRRWTSSKVKTAFDGRWRTLDPRALRHALVTLSKHYNAILANLAELTAGWCRRAEPLVGADSTAWARRLGTGQAEPM